MPKPIPLKEILTSKIARELDKEANSDDTNDPGCGPDHASCRFSFTRDTCNNGITVSISGDISGNLTPENLEEYIKVAEQKPVVSIKERIERWCFGK